MVVVDFFEGLQSAPGLFFEDAIAVLGGFRLQIRGAEGEQLADSRFLDFLIVFGNLPSAKQLPLHTGFLGDEQDHCVNGGPPKINSKLSIGKVFVELVDVVHEHLQAFNLDPRPGKAVEDGPVSKLFVQQASQEDVDDFFVTHHTTAIFESDRFR